MAGRILLVDDDESFLRLVEFELSEAGMRCASATSGASALRLLEREDPSVVLLDLNLPDVSGFELLERIHAERPTTPVVVLTAHGEVDGVVRCMRLGAVDFVQKPFDRTRLITSIRNAMLCGSLQARVESLTAELRSGEGFERILGASPALETATGLLRRAAQSDVTVLLQGESGTGKEVAARAVHAESRRRSGPFVAVNCGAIPETLIESELFGHEEGAFTGATKRRKGHFENADGGTLFLDEIGELPLNLQVRLLRVLQERVVRRLGSGQDRRIDIRIVAATNRDLRTAVAAGEFREDLFYRLAVFPVELPPLRRRDDDALLLTDVFVRRFAREHGRQLEGLTEPARSAVLAYAWPGNVRELENVLERAVILEEGDRIGLGSLPDNVVAVCDEASVPDVVSDGDPLVDATPQRSPAPVSVDQIRPLQDEEREIVHRALRLTGWNIQQAARRLGIGRATMYRKIERYALRPQNVGVHE
jgi:DNA-binding NtrC family response regulator